MSLHSIRFIPALLLIFAINIAAQQILEQSNTITVDNLDDNNLGIQATAGTNMSGPNYKEYPSDLSEPTVSDGWWTNTTGYGGNHRRSTRQGTGNSTGSRAVFSFDVPVTDHYLVYHHMPFSGNSSPNVNVKFYKSGEAEPAANFYYNERENNLADSKGSWFPLGIIEVLSSDSALTVEFGLDSTGKNILRADAVRILRSSQTVPDIEFGNRRSDITTTDPLSGDTIYSSSFYSERAPLDFPETIFKWGGYSEKQLPVYNLGSEPLVISGFASSTSHFSITNTTPIIIAPGEKTNIIIRFSPLGEEATVDTLFILSNDKLEPEAPLPVIGRGTNYNFILNASLDGTEPHWNAPEPELELIGSFLNSAPSPFNFPIPDGNLKSIVNTDMLPGTAVVYKFNLPDSLSGKYLIEYSGPAGSSSAMEEIRADVVTPGYINPDITLADTQRVFFIPRRPSDFHLPWVNMGIFSVNGNGQTKIILKSNIQEMFLRADLLRVKLAASPPLYILNLDSARINFDSVSIYDSIRVLQNNFSYNLRISSVGELPLRIDSIFFASGAAFRLRGENHFPVSVPAVNGRMDYEILFLPDEVKFYSDTMFIKSNDNNDSLKAIYLYGVGTDNITGINESENIPAKFLLEQNSPNPFNPTTQIRFALPQSGMVEMKIYDILGREVVTLLNGEHKAGTYTVEWNGRNNYGAQVSSGMYIYRITAGNFVQTKKMMMLK